MRFAMCNDVFFSGIGSFIVFLNIRYICEYFIGLLFQMIIYIFSKV
jgi:hypothetical protein